MRGFNSFPGGRLGGDGVRGEVPRVHADPAVVQPGRRSGQVRRQDRDPPDEESPGPEGSHCTG